MWQKQRQMELLFRAGLQSKSYLVRDIVRPCLKKKVVSWLLVTQVNNSSCRGVEAEDSQVQGLNNLLRPCLKIFKGKVGTRALSQWLLLPTMLGTLYLIHSVCTHVCMNTHTHTHMIQNWACSSASTA